MIEMALLILLFLLMLPLVGTFVKTVIGVKDAGIPQEEILNHIEELIEKANRELAEAGVKATLKLEREDEEEVNNSKSDYYIR